MQTVSFPRILVELAAALMLPAGAPAQQQGQQSVENANAFLREVLREGTGVAIWLAPSDRYRTWANVISTTSSGCTTTITAQRSDGIPIVRTIDWRRAHEIETGPQPGAPNYLGGIAIHGGVTGYGIDDGRMDLNATPDLRDRLEKAFNFLRNACDAGRQYGF